MNDSKRKQLTLTEDMKTWFQKMDLRQRWIALLFLAILTVSAVLNGYAMSYFFAVFIAYSLSGFMEVGTLFWDIARERAANSKGQQQVTEWLTWGNVTLFGLLLVVNLVRAANRGPEALPHTGLTFWDYVAFALIAISGFGHIVGYLLFRSKDEKLKHDRDMEEKNEELRAMERERELEERKRDNVLIDVQAKLQKRQMVYDRLNGLRDEYRRKHVPANEIDALLKGAAQTLELEFKVDYDGDGEIGHVHNLPRPPAAPELPFNPDAIVDGLNRRLQDVRESIADITEHVLGQGDGADPTQGSGSNHRG